MLVTTDIKLLPPLVAICKLIQAVSQILKSKDITLIKIDSALGWSDSRTATVNLCRNTMLE